MDIRSAVVALPEWLLVPYALNPAWARTLAAREFAAKLIRGSDVLRDRASLIQIACCLVAAAIDVVSVATDDEITRVVYVGQRTATIAARFGHALRPLLGPEPRFVRVLARQGTPGPAVWRVPGVVRHGQDAWATLPAMRSATDAENVARNLALRLDDHAGDA